MSDFPQFVLPTVWRAKIQALHHSPWHGCIEEAGTGSWLQTLLQTQAGASQTLMAAHTHYARTAQAQAYPKAPRARAVAADTVQHWAQQLIQSSDTSDSTPRFALAMSAVTQTHTQKPGSDTHGWLSLNTQDSRHWTLHFRCLAPDRYTQQMSCGLLGLELLYLLSQQRLTPQALELALQEHLEIDVWQSSEGDNTRHAVHLIQAGWSPLIYIHRGQAQRYLSALRDRYLLVAKGSFNPLTLAHQALLDTALQYAQQSPLAKHKTATPPLALFELALHNADKGQAAEASLVHRLHMLAQQDYPVVLTRTPTLLATKTLFLAVQAAHVDFVCGHDLYERVFVAKYYSDMGGIQVALQALFSQDTQLWVGQREANTYPPFQGTMDTHTQALYTAQIHQLPLAFPVSASAVRQAIAEQSGPWQHWVSPETATYITSHHLFTP